MTERGFQLILAPSCEWFSDGFVAGVVTNIAIGGMQKVAEMLNMLNSLGLKLKVEVSETPLTARPATIEGYIQFIVEVVLVGNDTVANREGKGSAPDLYDLRIPLDVESPTESGIETGAQLLDLLLLRNFTYLSARTLLGPGEIVPETVTDVFTDEGPVGFMDALKSGIAPDGGLYVPRCLPSLTRADLAYLANFPGTAQQRYHRTALFITERMMGLPQELTIDVEEIREAIIARVEALKAENQSKYDALAKAAAKNAAKAQDVASKVKDKVKESGIKDKIKGKAADKAAAMDVNVDLSDLDQKRKEILTMASEMFRQELEKLKSKVPEKIYALLLRVLRLFTGRLPARYGKDVPRVPAWAKCVDEAYNPENWGDRLDTVAPLVPAFGEKTKAVGFFNELKVNTTKFRVAEMWHGPTMGHKDYGHQLFPSLFKLANAGDEGAESREYVVACATNGESGVAAIDGLLRNGPPNLRIVIYYPSSGIPLVQRAQLLELHDGWRVHCVEVRGTYDDVQAHLHKLLNDGSLNLNGKQLVAANSVNYGRLLPMIIYFAQLYADSIIGQQLMGDAIMGRKEPHGIDVVVPMGNMNDVVAALMAKIIGIPIRTIIVGCNDNDAFVDLVKTGTFKCAATVETDSPAMDTTIAGNLERLLYFICDMDTNAVRGYMQSLEGNGKSFTLSKPHHAALQATFFAENVSDLETKNMMGEFYVLNAQKKMLDPSTGVAFCALQAYMDGPWKKLKDFDPRREKDYKNGKEINVKEWRLPIILCNTTHWSKSPEVALKALKKPLCGHIEVGMDRPEGWAPASGSMCCKVPEDPGQPDPPHRILERYLLTLQKVAPKLEAPPYEIRRLATHAPRLPPVEVSGYAGMIAELQAFAAKDWNPTFELDDLYQPATVADTL